MRFLRYGPPLHTTLVGRGRYDWEFADVTFADLRRRDIVPIVDLCHFGVPDWIGDFQNPDFPEHVRRATPRAFAERFPWVQLYTPVNEMFICAQFSGQATAGGTSRAPRDRTFVTALKHICQGQCAGHAGDPEGPARRDLHPERVLGIFPRREPRGDQAGRDRELQALPLARPELRPPGRLRRCTSTCSTTA